MTLDSLTKKNTEYKIIAAAARTSDNICLALTAVESPTENSVVLVYQAGLEQPWDKFVILGEVASVCTAPETEEGCEYIALMTNGDVVFLSDPPRIENVLTGSEPEGHKYFHKITNQEDLLFAIGTNADAYVRRDRTWQRLGRQKPIEATETDEIVFTSIEVLKSENRILLGGHSIPDTDVWEARLEEAFEADGDEFLDIFDEEIAENYGCHWMLEKGNWQKIEIPTNDYVVAFGKINENSYLMGIQEGKVFKCTVDDQIEDVFSPDTGSYLKAITKDGTNFVFVYTDGIFVYDGVNVEELEITGLKAGKQLFGYFPFEQSAFLVGNFGLAKQSESLWKKVTLPVDLLNAHLSD